MKYYSSRSRENDISRILFAAGESWRFSPPEKLFLAEARASQLERFVTRNNGTLAEHRTARHGTARHDTTRHVARPEITAPVPPNPPGTRHGRAWTSLAKGAALGRVKI